MITANFRFEAHDGEVFPAEISGEQDVLDFIKAVWRDKVPDELPYQLVDGQLVLRYARSLPEWIREELPDDAVAWAVLARHEKERWVILWVVPIFVGDEFGQRYIYGEELVLDPVDMRMVQ